MLLFNLKNLKIYLRNPSTGSNTQNSQGKKEEVGTYSRSLSWVTGIQIPQPSPAVLQDLHGQELEVGTEPRHSPRRPGCLNPWAKSLFCCYFQVDKIVEKKKKGNHIFSESHNSCDVTTLGELRGSFQPDPWLPWMQLRTEDFPGSSGQWPPVHQVLHPMRAKSECTCCLASLVSSLKPRI